MSISVPSLLMLLSVVSLALATLQIRHPKYFHFGWGGVLLIAISQFVHIS